MPKKRTKASSTAEREDETKEAPETAPEMGMALVAPAGVTAVFVGPTGHAHGQVVFCCEPECERVLIAHGYTWQLVSLPATEEDE